MAIERSGEKMWSWLGNKSWISLNEYTSPAVLALTTDDESSELVVNKNQMFGNKLITKPPNKTQSNAEVFLTKLPAALPEQPSVAPNKIRIDPNKVYNKPKKESSSISANRGFCFVI